jgi:hypothetical protein
LPDKSKNCFGNPDLDKGHSLVPEPPHKITGITVVINGAVRLLCSMCKYLFYMPPLLMPKRIDPDEDMLVNADFFKII